MFWVIVGFMVLSLVRSRANPDSLRRVGNVWDVLCFWPRAHHPFAVAPYAEYAVPQLQCYLHERAGAGVVIAAHSQGTVLTYAALAPLLRDGTLSSESGEPLVDRVALVTFGSPLRMLYAAAFPHYFRPEDFTALATALNGRWRNLFRFTDHVGWSVFADPAQVGEDPVDPDDPDGSDQPIPDPRPDASHVDGHGEYWTDPAVRAAVEAMNSALDSAAETGVRA